MNSRAAQTAGSAAANRAISFNWSRGEGSPTVYFVPGRVGVGPARRRKVWSLLVCWSVCLSLGGSRVGRGWVAGVPVPFR